MRHSKKKKKGHKKRQKEKSVPKKQREKKRERLLKRIQRWGNRRMRTTKSQLAILGLATINSSPESPFFCFFRCFLASVFGGTSGD